MIRIATIALVLVCAGCAAEPAANQTIQNYAMDDPPLDGTVNNRPVTEAVNAAEPIANAAVPADTAGLPGEVTKFLERRQGCEHFAGEPDWGDAARKKDLDEAVKELCPGIDAELAALRKKHASDAKVIAALAEYEPLGID
jgi:hypothetical protein